jgi:hypothetical protein
MAHEKIATLNQSTKRKSVDGVESLQGRSVGTNFYRVSQQLQKNSFHEHFLWFLRRTNRY